MTQYDAQHMRFTSSTISIDDWRTVTEIDLRFEARLDFETAKCFGLFGAKFLDESTDAVIATLVSVLCLQVLEDTLSR
jgi:hypothetical protein